MKVSLKKPVLISIYGFPGSGKTYVSRQICEYINAAHIHSDRIRTELFEHPRYDKQEDEIVSHIMEYMAQEFLHAGVSVVFDINAGRRVQRRKLRDIARQSGAEMILLWQQIDAESAFQRVSTRDRRRSDDKFSRPYNERASFELVISPMQNPVNEDYVVISGKHNFNNQRNVIIKKLLELGIIPADKATLSLVKPGMVNLIPNTFGGRVDNSRRNIVIR